ncbi:MAG TPA: hypothetical protein VGC41_16555 [Kofleriaceae bacterium]
MRKLLLVGALAGCGDANARVTDAKVDDASVVQADPFQDAAYAFCDAPENSSDVTIGGNPTTRMFAGGVDLYASDHGGSVQLVFTTTDHVGQVQMQGCNDASYANTCTLPGGGMQFSALAGTSTDTELYVFGTATTIPVTVLITQYASPLLPNVASPGLISGRISSADGSVSGTFSNRFCRAMLSATL